MVPHRKSDLSKIVISALFTGACVSFISACMAGMYLSLVTYLDPDKVSFRIWIKPSISQMHRKAPNLQHSEFTPK